jgi:hypothetical protein
MADSIHTARWICQIEDLGWDLHLFPSLDFGVAHPDLKNVTIHHSFFLKKKNTAPEVTLRGIPLPSETGALMGRWALKELIPNYRVWQLRRVIQKIRPNVIHSIEIQAGGYLTLSVKEQVGENPPPWIVTNWGSDLYLFGRLSDHVDRIKGVLSECDYYSCECYRDVSLAKQLGLKGEVLPIVPNGGGFDLRRAAELKHPGKTSARRLILLKGYHGWAGRALVGLRAIELSADVLQGYRIAIYMASPEVRIAAELLSKKTGIPIELVPHCSHVEMMRLYGQARIYVGLSISDAISTSLLEALVMGAFPIQSCTSCADEWIVDGESGFIVPPEDPEPVSAAIRRVISDDHLVDQAAEINWKTAESRLDENILRPQVIAMYEKVVSESKAKRQRGSDTR